MPKHPSKGIALILLSCMLSDAAWAADGNRELEQLRREFSQLNKNVERLARENENQKNAIRKLECRSQQMQEAQARLMRDMGDFVALVRSGKPQEISSFLETRLRQAGANGGVAGC